MWLTATHCCEPYPPPYRLCKIMEKRQSWREGAEENHVSNISAFSHQGPQVIWVCNNLFSSAFSSSRVLTPTSYPSPCPTPTFVFAVLLLLNVDLVVFLSLAKEIILTSILPLINLSGTGVGKISNRRVLVVWYSYVLPSSCSCKNKKHHSGLPRKRCKDTYVETESYQQAETG